MLKFEVTLLEKRKKEIEEAEMTNFLDMELIYEKAELMTKIKEKNDNCQK